MYNLKFHISLKDHPNKAMLEAKSEAWGIMSVMIFDGTETKNLARIEWDILCLAEWFIANKAVIATEDFFMLGERATPNESLSEAMHRIGILKFSLPFQKPEKIIEQEMEIYDTYYSRHSPYRDMIGSGMPEILIGLNNGIGEVSLLNVTENWKYKFDMKLFIEGFENELKRSISMWLTSNEYLDAQMRGKRIMGNL